MANTALGLGAFASGMANGMQMGMEYKKMQESGEQAKAATEKSQADKSTSAGPQQDTGAMGMPTDFHAYGQQPGATGGATPQQGAMGMPTGFQAYGQQPGAAATAQATPAAQPAAGGSPWSFISNLFGGSNG